MENAQRILGGRDVPLQKLSTACNSYFGSHVAYELRADGFAHCPSLSGLRTDGIESRNARRLHAFADGNHDELVSANLELDSVDFQILLDGYITAYGGKCSDYLPKDKVEWTIPKCDESARDSNGDFECVRPGEYHTHIYVDKNILGVKRQLMLNTSLPQEITPQGIRSVLPDMRQLIYRATSPIARQFYVDLWVSPAKMVLLNDCLSPQLCRFQDNLVRYALQIPTLTATVPLAATPNRPIAGSIGMMVMRHLAEA